MAAATVNKRYVVALGPIKMEFINVTASDTNTVVTTIQNPEYAIGVNNEDNDGATAALNVTLTANSRTLTLNATDLSSSEVNLLVFGF